ncbi:MAG: hypothetical protein ABIH50_00180 [bacterium]
MKKAIIYLFVVAFVASIASVAVARTLEEEKAAVRAYLKVIDAKIIKYRKTGNTAKMKLLQSQKQGTLARWEKLKAQMEAAPVAPVPPPPPAPRPMPKAAAPEAGLFGLGLNCDVAGMYINTGSGQLGGGLGLKGDLVLDDPLALGTMVGLSANAVQYKLGLGYVQGGGGIKAVPLYIGGVIMLPGDLMGAPLFVDGGLNYVVYGNGQKAGKIGGDVSVGVMFDLGLGLGKTAASIGYSVVRSDTKTDKGLSITVCQPFVL